MADDQGKTLRIIASEYAATMQCRCDLDNWEPERSTGHSWVCPIHKAANARMRELQDQARKARR